MNLLFDYWLAANCCLGTFYAFYYLLLKNDTHFQRNRAYLLGAGITALLLPCLQIELPTNMALPVVMPTLPIDTAPLPPAEMVEQSHSFHIWTYWAGGYIAISILFLMHRLWMMGVLCCHIVQQPVKKQDGYYLIQGATLFPICSFFHFVFWQNKTDLTPKQEAWIMAHELVHVRQGHTFDVLFFELLTILFWINPAVYLLKRSLREVHEFIADNIVIDDHHPYDYAQLLVQQVQASPPIPCLTNHFQYSFIKRRLIMMTKIKQRFSIYNYIKIIYVLPVLVILILVFACNKGAINQEKISILETEMPEMRPGMFVFACESNSPHFYKADGTPKTKAEVLDFFVRQKHQGGETQVTAEDIVLLPMALFNEHIQPLAQPSDSPHQPNQDFTLIWGNFKNGGTISLRDFAQMDPHQIKIRDQQQQAVVIKKGTVKLRYQYDPLESISCNPNTDEMGYANIHDYIINNGELLLPNEYLHQFDQAGESITFMDLVVIQDGVEKAIEGNYKFSLE